MSIEVIFWRKLDQSLVAQKQDKFFEIPKGSDFGESKESRQTIADNFDNCPILTDAIADFSGAEKFDAILPNQPEPINNQGADCAL